jgi:hypothetical protein
MRSLVDERKLYQTFFGAKNSIQEYTLGPNVAREMKYAYELASKELFPASQKSEKREEKPSQKDGQTGLEETNEGDESQPPRFPRNCRALNGRFVAWEQTCR